MMCRLRSGPCGSSVTETNGHVIENLKVNAAGLANYSVAADAITRSQVRFAMFEGARVAGLAMGYGWINEVFECYFAGNLIGLFLDNSINSVNVLDSNFEENSGVGIIANSGAALRIEGNEFESTGGPPIIANHIRALVVKSNYFEASTWHTARLQSVVSVFVLH
jgi:hypothetical protein